MDIDEQELTVSDLVAVLRRRFKLMVVVSSVILALGVLLAIFLPSIYRSQATILIERQEIPTDLVRSTVTSFAEQRIRVMSQLVLSSTSLSDLIERFDLYSDERERLPREEIIESMRENIALEMVSANVVDPKSGKPTEATIAFSISFENKSAQKSYRVVNELVTAFLNQNIKSRTDTAMETAAFLDDEAETLRLRVSDLETQIAAFKDEHADSRPELESLTRDLMNRTELHLSEVDRRIHETVQQKIYLEAEMARHDPKLPEPWPRSGSAPEQLRAIEAQLSAAEASYGDAHPDVIRLRKQADAMRATVDPHAARELYENQLESAQMQLQTFIERYEQEHPDVEKARKRVEGLNAKISALPPESDQVPNNPAYVALAARLEAAEAQITSLNEKRDELSTKLDGYAESLMMMPDAEAKFHALNRDYETAVAKYREVSAKQMEARLSQNLESERKGERFTLVEPPLLPEQPARPNRPAIVFISLLFCVIGGLGVVGLVETLDDRIHSRRGLVDIFEVPPLATIPIIEMSPTASDYSRLKVSVAALGVLMVIGLALIHFLVMPIDVFWFAALRKLGL